jgi:NTE family protein
MRVGLVLGAGGVVGASWLIGALDALESETGLAPARADVIVGTSAGSVVGAMGAAGVPPALLAAYASGRPRAELADLEHLVGDELDEIDRIASDSPDRFRLQLALPPIGPGSWRMALSTLRRPLRHTPAAVLGGWLPRGVVRRPQPLRRRRRLLAVKPRPAVPRGRRRRRVPEPHVDERARVPRSLNPVAQVSGAMRAAASRRLASETRKLEASGVRVVTIEPSAADLAAMGHNLMARGRRAELPDQAYRSVARSLRRRTLPDFGAGVEKTRAPLRRVA